MFDPDFEMYPDEPFEARPTTLRTIAISLCASAAVAVLLGAAICVGW